MKFKEIIRLIFLLFACHGFVHGQEELYKYRGIVKCQFISINDTMRLSCQFNSHPDYVDYLEENWEAYETVSNGEFKSINENYFLWYGTYYFHDKYGKVVSKMTFENGMLKKE